jgi:subtilisin family serine protease
MNRLLEGNQLNRWSLVGATLILLCLLSNLNIPPGYAFNSQQVGKNDIFSGLTTIKDSSLVNGESQETTKRLILQFSHNSIDTGTEAGLQELADIIFIESRGRTRLIRTNPIIHAATFEIDESAIESIRRLPFVRQIWTDDALQISDVPSDIIVPYNGEGGSGSAPMRWSYESIGCDLVHGEGVSGEGVKIAIIDTGIDTNHPDLAGKFILSTDVSTDDWDGYDPSDHVGHGTHIAGIIAADGVVVGVAPNASILNIKVFHRTNSETWEAYISDVIEGIQVATINGADIISLSLGYNPTIKDGSDPLSQAADEAFNLGAFVVASVGNEGPEYGTITSPAIAKCVVGVGAMNIEGTVPDFSSRGPTDDGRMKPDLVAPGVSVYSTLPNNSYGYLSGTSMAAPHVAGIAALLLSLKPNLTNVDIWNCTLSSAISLSLPQNIQGRGMADSFGAYIAAANKRNLNESAIVDFVTSHYGPAGGFTTGSGDRPSDMSYTYFAVSSLCAIDKQCDLNQTAISKWIVAQKESSGFFGAYIWGWETTSTRMAIETLYLLDEIWKYDFNDTIDALLGYNPGGNFPIFEVYDKYKSLLLLGQAGRINETDLIYSLSGMQNQDGSFGGPGTDPRYSYMVLDLLKELNALYSINQTLASDWLLRCENEIGGFGSFPGCGSDLEMTFYAINALRILESESLINSSSFTEFILGTQRPDGLWAYRGNPSDVQGTYFAVCSMAAVGLISSLNTTEIGRKLCSCENEDKGFWGQFCTAYESEDLRVTNWALCVLNDLNQLDLINRTKTVDWLLSHQTSDGGFTNTLGFESSAFWTYYVLESLDILKALNEINKTRVVEYLTNCFGWWKTGSILAPEETAYYTLMSLDLLDSISNLTRDDIKTGLRENWGNIPLSMWTMYSYYLGNRTFVLNKTAVTEYVLSSYEQNARICCCKSGMGWITANYYLSKYFDGQHYSAYSLDWYYIQEQLEMTCYLLKIASITGEMAVFPRGKAGNYASQYSGPSGLFYESIRNMFHGLEILRLTSQKTGSLSLARNPMVLYIDSSERLVNVSLRENSGKSHYIELDVKIRFIQDPRGAEINDDLVMVESCPSYLQSGQQCNISLRVNGSSFPLDGHYLVFVEIRGNNSGYQMLELNLLKGQAVAARLELLQAYSAPSIVEDSRIGDVNGDGNVEYIVRFSKWIGIMNQDHEVLNVLEADGHINEITVADLDLDGTDEIVALTSGYGELDQVGINVFNATHLLWRNQTIIPPGNPQMYSYEVEVGDVQGDAFPEVIAVFHKGGAAFVTANDKDGNFLWKTYLGGGHYTVFDLVLSNIIGDEHCEILVGKEYLYILHGNGTLYSSFGDGGGCFRIMVQDIIEGSPSEIIVLQPRKIVVYRFDGTICWSAILDPIMDPRTDELDNFLCVEDYNPEHEKFLVVSQGEKIFFFCTNGTLYDSWSRETTVLQMVIEPINEEQDEFIILLAFEFHMELLSQQGYVFAKQEQDLGRFYHLACYRTASGNTDILTGTFSGVQFWRLLYACTYHIIEAEHTIAVTHGSTKVNLNVTAISDCLIDVITMRTPYYLVPMLISQDYRVVAAVQLFVKCNTTQPMLSIDIELSPGDLYSIDNTTLAVYRWNISSLDWEELHDVQVDENWYISVGVVPQGLIAVFGRVATAPTQSGSPPMLSDILLSSFRLRRSQDNITIIASIVDLDSEPEQILCNAFLSYPEGFGVVAFPLMHETDTFWMGAFEIPANAPIGFANLWIRASDELLWESVSTPIDIEILGADLVIVDQWVLSDNRIDVGQPIQIQAHCRWDNGSDIALGIVYVNGTAVITNSTGWLIHGQTIYSVSKTSWTVTSVSCSGVSEYVVAVICPSVIWDQLEVNESAMLPSEIEVGGTSIIWFELRYAFDNSLFNGSLGQAYVNGTALSWNTMEERWELHAAPIEPGIYKYVLSAITDFQYALKGFVDVFDDRTLTVHAQESPIFLSTPDNIVLVEGMIGQVLAWIATDITPGSYSIVRNTTQVAGGSWSSGSIISIILDNLTLGNYLFNCTVFDMFGNMATDLVLVNLNDGTNPTIDSPLDTEYNELTTGHTITWAPYDLHPQNYVIYLDGNSVRVRTWNSSSETITISVDGHGIGIYNYTIVVTDVGGNMAIDGVFVTVVDAKSPTIDAPIDFEYDEFSIGHAITWHPIDANPQSYLIYKDGVLVKSGTWNSSSEVVGISVDNLNLGVYNYTIVVIDADSNTASDQVTITVIDGTSPTINAPSDIQYDELNTGYSITWSPYDLHPKIYAIYLDGSLVKLGPWNSSSEVIIISVDGLVLGEFNYTIVMTDVGSNTVSDIVLVRVVDGTAPTINSPPYVEYTEGETGNQIEWQPYDLHPETYEILRNGSPILTEDWESSPGSIMISVDGLTAGIYNYMIIVTDIGGNTAFDTVVVTVLEPSVTTTTTTTSTTTTNGTQTGYSDILLIIAVGAGGAIIIVIIMIIISSKKGWYGK